MKAASDKIIAEAKAAEKVPEPPKAVPADKDKAPDAGGVVSGDTAEADKANAPAKPDALDLSFLPENVRSKVTVADDEALAVLKSGFMAHPVATKKFQDASKLREEAEALKRSAANYDFLMADEARAAKVLAIMSDKGGTPPVDDAEELDTLDPKSVLSVIDKRVEKAKADVRAELRREADAPKVWADSMNSALGEYAEKHSVDVDTMTAAIKLAEADFKAENVRPEPEDVPRLMGAYVRLARLTPKPAAATPPVNKPATGNGHAGLETVTSPTARGGPFTGNVVPFPAHWKNGEQPLHESEDQMATSHLYRMRVRFGPQVTLEDVVAGARSR